MKVAILGCGVMGTAFARHLASKHALILCDHDLAKVQSLAKELGAIAQEDLGEAVKEADIVLLTVKPKDLAEVARLTASLFSKDKILVSVLAGTPIAVLKRYFPQGVIVRAMPNLAVAAGQGVIGLSEEGFHTVKVTRAVDSLMHGLGLYAWMKEDKLDALTAISGSGIGFVLVMIEAMIDGSIHLGFNAAEAREFVLKTMEGAVALMRESGKHPAELKLDISSPGGTTIAGLKVMEAQGVRSGIIHTLIASYEKALNMMKSLEK